MLKFRDTITIRGAFRFKDLDALEDALWATHLLLGQHPRPVSFSSWISIPSTLSIEVVVHMFVDHDLGPALCETLGATATHAACVVRASPWFAGGTSAAHVRCLPDPDLTEVLDGLAVDALCGRR